METNDRTGGPVRLLIVDDDDSMRMVCRRFFTKFPPARGIEIAEAASGEIAIEMLTRESYDCVLSDYRMGAVTGIDVLAFALTERPQAVRIMMSGFGSPDLVKAAQTTAHIHEFIEKPMAHNELERALREHVRDRYLVVVRPPGP